MRRRRPRQRGIALLMVVWVFMVLGVIALDFAQYMRDEAQAALNLGEETRAYYAAVGGVHETLERLLIAAREGELFADEEGEGNDEPGVDEDDGDLDVLPGCAFGDARGTVEGIAWEARVCDEAGRIGLVADSEPLLTAAVRNLLVGGNATTGIDRRAGEEVQTVVDSILDWIDHDSLTRPHGAELDWYEDRLGWTPQMNRAFSYPEELLMVRGVTEALFYGADGRPGLRDVVSVFNMSGALHLTRSPEAVLEVLCGISAEEAAELKTTGDPVAIQGCLPADVAAAIEGDDETAEQVSIEVRADPAWKRNRASVALVADLSGGSEPRLLFWLDRSPWAGVRVGAPPDYPEGGA